MVPSLRLPLSGPGFSRRDGGALWTGAAHEFDGLMEAGARGLARKRAWYEIAAERSAWSRCIGCREPPLGLVLPLIGSLSPVARQATANRLRLGSLWGTNPTVSVDASHCAKS